MNKQKAIHYTINDKLLLRGKIAEFTTPLKWSIWAPLCSDIVFEHEVAMYCDTLLSQNDENFRA